MLIPITFNASESLEKLPPSLAKISHDEVVLIELQGALEIDSSRPNERDGKLVGTLSIDKDLVRSIRPPLVFSQINATSSLCPETAHTPHWAPSHRRKTGQSS